MNFIWLTLWGLTVTLLISCRADEDVSATLPIGEASPEDIWQLPLTIGTPIGLTNNTVKPTIAIKGCKSGYEAEVPVESVGIALYKNDSNCLAYLEAVQIGDSVFEVSGQYQPAQGSINTFRSNEGSEAKVLVESQLSSPLKLSDSISFKIAHIQSNGEVLVENLTNLISVEIDQQMVTEDFGRVLVTVKKHMEKNKEPLKVALKYSGNATAGEDYANHKTEVTIPGGETSIQFAIDILDDRRIEHAEVLVVEPEASERYFVVETGELTIEDDDKDNVPAIPTIHYHPNSIVENKWRVEKWHDHSGNEFHATTDSYWYSPFYFSKVVHGYAAAGFDGRIVKLNVPSSEKMDLAAAHPQKSILVAFRMAGDIERKQVIYEQGGLDSGISLTVEGGKAYCNSWSSQGHTAVEAEKVLQKKKYKHWYWYYRGEKFAEDAFEGIAVRSLSGSVKAYHHYVLGLRYDSESGFMDCYLNGSHIGRVAGADRLPSHGDGIGLGSVNGYTRFSDGSQNSQNSGLRGFVSELIAFGETISSDDFTVTLSHIAKKYGFYIPTVTMIVDQKEVTEGKDSVIKVRAYRDRVGDEDLIVQYKVSGDAAAGTDYIHGTGVVTIPAGSISGVDSIQLLDDSVVEEEETLGFELVSDNSYNVGSAPQLVFIKDDDRRARLL